MGNQIAVADRENDRVQILSLSGEAKRIIENQFNRPFDVGFDSDTSLYIVDCNKNRVQKFDRFGNHLLTIYDNSLKLPKGCDVKDALYLSDTHNDRILKFPGWFSVPRNERLEMFRELLSKRNSLSLVYPNPCNQTAKIYLRIEGESESLTPSISSMGSTSSHSVQLDIYNITGRRIKRLFEGQISTSQYILDWDLRDEKGSIVPSGIYFYKLTIDESTESNKIVVVR
jgi:DNA-binding beta-propeller fold protein YncE